MARIERKHIDSKLPDGAKVLIHAKAAKDLGFDVGEDVPDYSQFSVKVGELREKCGEAPEDPEDPEVPEVEDLI